MIPILKVELDDRFPGLICVTDVNGATMRYRAVDGLLYPGRPWTCVTPEGYRVVLFLPFGEAAPPQVLSVEAPGS